MQAHPEGTDLSRPSDYRFFIYLVIFIAFCLAYRSFLSDSLWLDECISYWVSSGGLQASISKSWNYQGQSPLYYAALSLWMDLTGNSEIAIRSLSLLCLLTSSAVLFVWLRKSLSPIAAFSGCVIFICQDSTLLALSARPYALAIMFCVLAMSELYKIAEDQSSKANSIRFTIFGCLAIYAHYFSALSIFASALCLLILVRLEKRALVQIVLALFAILSLCIPLLPQLKLLNSKAGEISFAPKLSLYDLPEALIPAFPAAALLIAFIACSLLLKKPIQSLFKSTEIVPKSARRMFLIAAAWWLLPFFVLFTLSIITGNSFLIPRYLSFSSPAFGIVAAILIARIRTDQQHIVLVVLTLLLGLREINRNWAIEDWRSAIRMATKDSSNILMASGLAETDHLSWLESPSNDTQQYLVSPAQVYASAQNAEAIPSQIEKDHLKAFLVSKINKHLSLYGKATVIFDAKRNFRDKLFSITEELGLISQQKMAGKIEVVEISR